jgi:6,7-dimethyl-8-ribityllumazine synthase
VQTAPDQWAYLYHAYRASSNVFTGREGMLADLVWRSDDWPSLVARTQATNTAQNIKTSFYEQEPAVYWQWDFRNSTPVVAQKNGQLHLSGATKPTNITGVVYAVRPVSGHFDMITTIANRNATSKGLVVYGDANAAIGVGVRGNTVEFWVVKDTVRRIIASRPLNSSLPQLKLTLNADRTCQAFYKTGKQAWQPLAAPQPVGFLPQWDRSPRAGLYVNGRQTEEGVFAEFEMVNK